MKTHIFGTVRNVFLKCARVSVVLSLLGLLLPHLLTESSAQVAAPPGGTPAPSHSGAGYVAVIDMNMMILPGTQYFLEEAIAEAHERGAKMLVVRLDTPGGMLQTSQLMIQAILGSPVPVAIYVSPSGGTATSAGVFITLAGHVAAMAPGTSIGAAKPVMGDGKDIEGAMAEKAQNITIAMVKSIAERRGRNVAWAEKAVKESASLTESEALAQGVVDLVAEDVNDLLRRIKGKEVKLQGSGAVTLDDYSNLPREEIPIPTRYAVLNVLANPSVIAILWLAATTGISIELYNPGLIFPGVVGVICLILALAMSQIIPVNQAALLLLGLGGVLIGAEIYTGTLILGVLGVVAMVLGAMYLVDVSAAPGMTVALEVILPVAIVMAGFLLIISLTAARVLRRRAATGLEGLIGQVGIVVDPLTPAGKISVVGELWNAVSRSGEVSKNSRVKVVGAREGFVLEVERPEE